MVGSFKSWHFLQFVHSNCTRMPAAHAPAKQRLQPTTLVPVSVSEAVIDLSRTPSGFQSPGPGSAPRGAGLITQGAQAVSRVEQTTAGNPMNPPGS